jgi:alkanesulfonate monooxygenase SsuD/methylene tetrahydromethanopterin reductase-like flavin-dependent oxidoreductase (luciferase family)
VKASIYSVFSYSSPDPVPAAWPVPPAYYDRRLGLQSLFQTIEQLELADRLGFDWVSFAEHHYSNGSIAPQPALAAAAMVTRIHRAKIAILGHTLPLNNPVRVAEELAMLDNLSEGRLVVGFHRGTPNEYQVYGVNPAETRDRATESMALILRAWSEPQPFGWQGCYFQYRTVSVWPRPLQQPRPSCYVLGTSQESAQFAARNHLGLGFAHDRPDLFGPTVDYYRQQCAIAGWQPTAEEILYRGTIHVAESDEEAEAELLRRRRVRGEGGGGRRLATSVIESIAAVDPNPRNPLAGYGSLERRPEVTFIGGPDTVARQLRECHEACGAGVVDITFQRGGIGHEQVMRAIELFGTKVLPQIRDV